MKTLNVGLIGFGIIGTGVVRVLQKNARIIETRLGAKLRLAAIADLDLKTNRGVKIDKRILTKDGFAVCRDPAIDIVIELVGGTGVASKFIETALQHGKHVISANKALLSEKGEPLFKLAEKQNKLLLFEAAVGGAIPVVRTLKEDLAGEKIERIYGIVNGTCNYILTELAKGGVDFTTVLRDAQRLGFAEADPTLDIEGGDTAHKLALLAMLAFGTRVKFREIYTEGITQLSQHDFVFARRLGRVIKLVAVGKHENGKIELRVHPTLLPKDSPLAKIDGATNAISLWGPHLGECILAGQGAGSLPTATAVVGDLIEAARAVLHGSAVPVRGVQPSQLVSLPVKKIAEVASEYYLRFTVRDTPGVVRDISRVLAKHKLNVRDIMQLDLKEFTKAVPLVMIVHKTREGILRKAISEIDRLSCVRAKTVVLRVEE